MVNNIEVFNIYFKNIELDTEDLKDFYKTKGFNVSIEEIKKEEIIYKVTDLEKNTSILFKKKEFDNYKKRALLTNCEMYSEPYFILDVTDMEFEVSIDQSEDMYFLLYLFYLYLDSKTKTILYNGRFMLTDEVNAKLNQLYYCCSNSYDDQNDLYEFISKCLKITLDEAKRVFKDSIKIDDVKDCVYIKMFDDRNLILNTVTKEYLFCKYIVSFDELLKFYIDGKRFDEANDIIEHRIEEETNLKMEQLREKSLKDGVDYRYVLENSFDDFTDGSDILNEKTLFMFINDCGLDSWWGHFYGDLEFVKKLLNHKFCTLSVAVLIYNRVREWAGIEDGYDLDLDAINEYCKFLCELYNDIKNFKYPIGELLPNIKIKRKNLFKKYYDYSNVESIFSFDPVLEFEKEDNEFNNFFKVLYLEVMNNMYNCDKIIEEIRKDYCCVKKDYLHRIIQN